MIVYLCAAISAVTDAKITRESIDDCEDLECLSNLMSESFGMKKAPGSDAGFISTWLWYEQMRRELAKEKQTRAMSKRGVGNLYQMMKTANFA
ncbi:unnamed protein product [Oikopleura dioica]|uniref:Uncharacterized protein n=1 Tax=Oikopleura dioica TaxID=34765 RepID=E4WTM7_OIKDI|nr:unnamed protein product [Oikopleura dioica]